MKKISTFFKGKQFYSVLHVISLFLIVLSGSSQPVSQTYSSAGTYTYTVPAGYSAVVTIMAWGAGGGGGNNSSGAKGGGGGGAYASLSTILTAGNYSVTVGTGGSPNVNGGNSRFTTIVVADGGTAASGTNAGAGGTTAASTGLILFAGGSGAAASGNNGGGGAGSALVSANGGNASGIFGGIGMGTGGSGGPGGNNAGASGASPGAGGGGKAGPGNSSNSGSGADGTVIVTVNSILSVKISNISVFEKLQGIQLEWTAYQEVNNSRYSVERSTDAINYISIGEVVSQNSIAETKYGFFDSSPIQGVNFYRLRIIDKDNRFVYSAVVKINLDKSVKDISLYPNPAAGGYISFQGADLAKGNYTVKIYNNTGMLVMNQSFTHSGGAINQTLNLPTGAKSGMYSLQLVNDGVKVMSKAFIVQ